MAFVIKDTKRHEYYRQRVGNGWYSSDINHARIYSEHKQAQRTIDKWDHHVSYGRSKSDLDIVEVKIIELP